MSSADRKTNDWGTFLGANLALEVQILNTTRRVPVDFQCRFLYVYSRAYSLIEYEAMPIVDASNALMTW